MANRRLEETRCAVVLAPSRASTPGRTVARGLVLAAATLALAGSAGATPAEELLTLDAAVSRALANNPVVHAAALAVRSDDEAVAAARTRYLPQVSGQAQAGKLLTPVEVDFQKGAFGTVPGVGPIPNEDVTVRSNQDLTASVSGSVMQPLTQLYTARQGVILAETGREADRAVLQAERAGTVADVKRLYYQLVASQGTLAAAREQLQTQRELARVVSHQVVQQAALRSDELLARSAEAGAALQLLSIENDLTTGKEQMNRLLGRDVRTPFRVVGPGELDADPLDLEAARARALLDRPELRQARLAVEKAEAEHRMKRWEQLPEVSVGVSYTSSLNVDTLPRNIVMAGAFAKWSLEWGRGGKEVAQKSLAIDEARAKARDAEAAVLVEVGDRYRKLALARAQVEAARLQLEGLRAKAPVVANRYRLEAALLKDALDVQASLAQASSDHQKALLSLWSARTDLELALGVAP